jgi:multidrug efflux pump
MTLFIVPTAYSYLARNTGSPLKRTKQLERLTQEVAYEKGSSQ